VFIIKGRFEGLVVKDEQSLKGILPERQEIVVDQIRLAQKAISELLTKVKLLAPVVLEEGLVDIDVGVDAVFLVHLVHVEVLFFVRDVLHFLYYHCMIFTLVSFLLLEVAVQIFRFFVFDAG